MTCIIFSYEKKQNTVGLAKIYNIIYYKKSRKKYILSSKDQKRKHSFMAVGNLSWMTPERKTKKLKAKRFNTYPHHCRFIKGFFKRLVI